MDHSRVGRPRLAVPSAVMATLLIVHHTSSPALQAMFEAVAAGAATDEIDGIEVAVRPR